MGNAGHGPILDFDRCVENENLFSAWVAAIETPNLSLAKALRLTLLVAKKGRQEKFEATARRWIARYCEEHKPSMWLLREIARDLDNVGEPECAEETRRESEARLTRILQAIEQKASVEAALNAKKPLA